MSGRVRHFSVGLLLLATAVSCHGAPGRPSVAAREAPASSVATSASPTAGPAVHASAEPAVPSLPERGCTAALPCAEPGADAGASPAAPPDPPPGGEACSEVLAIIRDGGLAQNRVTILTPSPDETVAAWMDETAARIAKLKIADPRIKELAGTYEKALRRSSNGARDLAKLMKAGVRTDADRAKSNAIGKRLQDAQRDKASTQRQLELGCGAPK